MTVTEAAVGVVGLATGLNSSPAEPDSAAPVRPVACEHCAEEMPEAIGPGPHFCCAGCEGAYQLIHGWGLDDYYALRDQLTGGQLTGGQLTGGQLTGGPLVGGQLAGATHRDSFEELDDPAVVEAATERLSDGSLSIASWRSRGCTVPPAHG